MGERLHGVRMPNPSCCGNYLVGWRAVYARIALAALLLITSTMGPAKSATMELQVAVLPKNYWGSKVMTPPDRRAMAVAQVAYWKAVGDRIPRLSPSEVTWIEGELHTTDSARLVAAMGRREGALYLALSAVEFCRNAYTDVIGKVGGGATNEALAWVHSLRCYASTPDLPGHLLKAGLISSARFDAEIKMQFFSIWWQATLRAIESALLEH